MVDAHGEKAARVLWARRRNSRRHDAAGYRRRLRDGVRFVVSPILESDRKIPTGHPQSWIYSLLPR